MYGNERHQKVTRRAIDRWQEQGAAPEDLTDDLTEALCEDYDAAEWAFGGDAHSAFAAGMVVGGRREARRIADDIYEAWAPVDYDTVMAKGAEIRAARQAREA